MFKAYEEKTYLFVEQNTIYENKYSQATIDDDK